MPNTSVPVADAAPVFDTGGICTITPLLSTGKIGDRIGDLLRERHRGAGAGRAARTDEVIAEVGGRRRVRAGRAAIGGRRADAENAVRAEIAGGVFAPRRCRSRSRARVLESRSPMICIGIARRRRLAADLHGRGAHRAPREAIGEGRALGELRAAGQRADRQRIEQR